MNQIKKKTTQMLQIKSFWDMQYSLIISKFYLERCFLKQMYFLR